MNRMHKTLVLVACLIAGGCASVDQVADTPVAPAPEPAPVHAPNKTRSLHLLANTSTPAEPVEDSALESDAVPEEMVEESTDFWGQLREGFRLPGLQQSSVMARAAEYGNHPQQVERIFKRGEPYLAYILGEVQKRNFPTEIVLLPFIESGYDPFAYSYGRAAGMWQFIPGTGEMYGLQQDWWYDGRRDVVESTQAALNYLDYLQDKFDGDWLLAIAAYNSGSGTVSNAILKNRKAGKAADFWHLDLPKETSAYVPKLLAIRRVVQYPEQYNLSLAPLEAQPTFTVIDIPGQLDISVAAKLAEMDTEAFYLLNPGYNRWTTHPDGPHQVLVPVEHSTVFRQNMATLPESERTRLVRHQVRSGETLSGIAQHYNTTTNALISSNQLSTTLIRIGQHLLVPEGSQDAAQYAALNRKLQAANGARSKQTYKVRRGDSLWTIARRHRVTVKQVSHWNNLDAATPIKPGQQLVIYKNATSHNPARRVRTLVYTVRSGDSLYRISEKFNVSINDLRRWNNLDEDHYLQPGQNLKLHVDVTQLSKSSHG
jgi:membrane-bound lytic murein transglycosylase D